MKKAIVGYGLLLLIAGIIVAVVDAFGVIIPITWLTYMNSASFMWAVEGGVAAVFIIIGGVLVSWGIKKNSP